MRTDIIEYLQKEVYHRCKQPTNKFGMGCYYHIEAVVKNAEILAEKCGADKETVIIAAWLHDIKICLVKNGYPPQYSPEVFNKVMEQVENFEEYSESNVSHNVTPFVSKDYKYEQTTDSTLMVAEPPAPYGK